MFLILKLWSQNQNMTKNYTFFFQNKLCTGFCSFIIMYIGIQINQKKIVLENRNNKKYKTLNLRVKFCVNPMVWSPFGLCSLTIQRKINIFYNINSIFFLFFEICHQLHMMIINHKSRFCFPVSLCLFFSIFFKHIDFVSVPNHSLKTYIQINK